jgi:hypothetical protein
VEAKTKRVALDSAKGRNRELRSTPLRART